MAVKTMTITNMIHAMAEDMPTLYSEKAELYTISEISVVALRGPPWVMM